MTIKTSKQPLRGQGHARCGPVTEIKLGLLSCPERRIKLLTLHFIVKLFYYLSRGRTEKENGNANFHHHGGLMIS